MLTGPVISKLGGSMIVQTDPAGIGVDVEMLNKISVSAESSADPT